MRALRNRRAAAALFAALTLGLGACNSGGDEGGEDQGSGKAKEVRTVEVVQSQGTRQGGLNAAALYDRVSPGVVTILSIFNGGAASLLGEEGGEGGQGSGFVLDGEGYIATNAHVVTSGDPPDRKRAKEVYVEFSDGNRVKAKIIGEDPNADVALLKIDPSGLSLTPVKLGRSRDITVGEPVAAIGSPFGERQSLSIGVISAIDRAIESLTRFQIGNSIQTDAAINPGNSGGPLLSAGGAVLGINSQIKSTSGGGEGVGFAIPVDTVRRSLSELREKGRVDYGYLGVESVTLWPQAADRLNVDTDNGAVLGEIQAGSPAEDADLKGGRPQEFQGGQLPVGGDVIVAVDGRKLTRRVDLADLVSSHSAGDKIELEVIREGDRRTVDVTLGKRPDSPPDPQP
ncbi:MAG TPA: trypsin-like peptidase domain-containing protein [Thermoleophilaceae bacterium]|nr:trypsin-like peptidase domain-containing protein [Thermoleophilaceae bacterium]